VFEIQPATNARALPASSASLIVMSAVALVGRREDVVVTLAFGAVVSLLRVHAQTG
jgi:hypothetical protein